MKENLHAKEAVEKLRDIIEESSTCLFGTNLSVLPVHVCPMQVQEVDDAGDLWFFSAADSEHNAHLKVDSRVQLFFTNVSRYEFLTIFGNAEEVNQPAKVRELWDASVKAWFPEGENDPNLSLLRIRPTEAHYWGTKNGKVVSLLKMVGAAITGKQPDIGEEGHLNP